MLKTDLGRGWEDVMLNNTDHLDGRIWYLFLYM